MLSRIRVVLSHTSHPGNIGASARAMKTMGLERLFLVSPKQFPHAEATARASGADDVLASATVCADIDTALRDCVLVAGASARNRSIPCPTLDPAGFARMAVRESAQGDVALLFGCEQSGLSNSELDRCHYLVQIATSPVYGSLNLAAAVQVLCYELRVAMLSVPDAQADRISVCSATADDMERFYVHLEQVLIRLDFLDPDNPRQLMRRLRRLYNRARPDANEMNILRGILSAVEDRLET